MMQQIRRQTDQQVSYTRHMLLLTNQSSTPLEKRACLQAAWLQLELTLVAVALELQYEYRVADLLVEPMTSDYFSARYSALTPADRERCIGLKSLAELENSASWLHNIHAALAYLRSDFLRSPAKNASPVMTSALLNEVVQGTAVYDVSSPTASAESSLIASSASLPERKVNTLLCADNLSDALTGLTHFLAQQRLIHTEN